MSRKEKELRYLLNLWNDNIINHRKGTKTYTQAITSLEKKYDSLLIKQRYYLRSERTNAFILIYEAIKTYQKLLSNKQTVLNNKNPWRVGLNEFFKFRERTEDVFMVAKSGDLYKLKELYLNGFKSWFDICSEDIAFGLHKFGRMKKDKYPKITKGFKKKWTVFCGQYEFTITQENNIRILSERIYNFWKTYHKKFRLQDPSDADKPEYFIKYLFKFLEAKGKTGNSWQLYYFLTTDFLEGDFKHFLKSFGYLI